MFSSSLSRHSLIVHRDSTWPTNGRRNDRSAFVLNWSLWYLGLNPRLRSLNNDLWTFLNWHDRCFSKYNLIFGLPLALKLLVYLLHQFFSLLLRVIWIQRLHALYILDEFGVLVWGQLESKITSVDFAGVEEHQPVAVNFIQTVVSVDHNSECVNFQSFALLCDWNLLTADSYIKKFVIAKSLLSYRKDDIT